MDEYFFGRIGEEGFEGDEHRHIIKTYWPEFLEAYDLETMKKVIPTEAGLPIRAWVKQETSRRIRDLHRYMRDEQIDWEHRLLADPYGYFPHFNQEGDGPVVVTRYRNFPGLVSHFDLHEYFIEGQRFSFRIPIDDEDI